MRIIFARMPGDTRYKFSGGMAHADGVPRSVNTSGPSLAANFALTSNKGNMFIGDAPMRLFDYDRRKSSYCNLNFLQGKAGTNDEFAALVDANADMIVFAMANMIRPNQDHESLLSVLEAIRTPFIVLGAGMQSLMESNLKLLSPSTARVLEIFNERAAIFGVRGKTTLDWLHSVGLTRAEALGCPSMYVYPANIAGLQPVTYRDGMRFLSASYLSPKSQRAKLLAKFWGTAEAVDYVFQDEIFHHQVAKDLPDGVLNDATGECDPDVVSKLVSTSVGTPQPYRRYWYFQEVEAWRQCASHYDVFLGDRFHGAVASMQAGTPAAIVYKDARVQELTEYFGVPRITFPELADASVADIVNRKFAPDAMAAFREQYVGRFRHFAKRMKQAGLKLAHSQAVLDKVM